MSIAAASLGAARPDESVQHLDGHSGAELLLFRRDGRSFVRKTAGTRGGNVRLRQQALRQRLYAAQGFAFPAIQTIDTDAEGRAFFEMDYIPARTLAEIVGTAAPYDRAVVFGDIAELIDGFAALAGAPLDAALFHGKIADIARAAETRPALAGHRDAVASLARVLAERDWSGIPYSPGHGDLTLENILVSPERGVVFIDCDEPWASSFWLDLAKLFQDIDGRWFLRGHSRPSVDALERLALLGRQFRTLAQAIDPCLPPRIPQLAALHLFRTLPYAQDAGTAAFVCAATARILEAP